MSYASIVVWPSAGSFLLAGRCRIRHFWAIETATVVIRIALIRALGSAFASQLEIVFQVLTGHRAAALAATIALAVLPLAALVVRRGQERGEGTTAKPRRQHHE